MADKRSFIITDFQDASFADTGAKRSFAAGSIETLPEGVFANYEAAGLVRAANADDKKAAEPST